jgi:chemotaxis protein methyltransferase CheR
VKHLENVADAQALAMAIVDTIPEPFVILDHDLRVLSGSRRFFEVFDEDPEQTRGRLLYELGGGQWDIPALRLLLETIIPEHSAMDGFEVEHDFAHLGRRMLLLNARLVRYQDGSSPNILLAFTDITQRHAIEAERKALLERTEELVRQQQTLLREMEHRIANSLQIIASILLLKASAVGSDETRHELHDAHRRVMSVAEVQRHLRPDDGIDQIEIGEYLSKLCGGLASSMIGGARIQIEVVADSGTLDSSSAVSMGLIVTELVINAIKYAFPTEKAGARILVSYEVRAPDWKLTISDNGIGHDVGETSSAGGLGTAIIDALSKQLQARIETKASSTSGTSVSIAHGKSGQTLPKAA